MIICAAIKITEVATGEFIVICGLRHGNCFNMIQHLDARWKSVNSKRCVVQGFINHNGEFLDRKEAFQHAKEIGQSNATQRYYWEDHGQEELYSEDLY